MAPADKATKDVFVPAATYEPPEWGRDAHVAGSEAYEALYRQSIDDPAGFWAGIADRDYHWHRRWAADHCK